jgi:hypothetical protein
MLTVLLYLSAFAYAQDDTTNVRNLEVYGFVQTDIGYNFNQINPNWFDALRVTKLPSYKNQFAPDGNAYFSVRQTRFGVRGWTQTPIGELKTVFEFDMFGVGVDEGQTTIRPRHFYAELGPWLVGQTNTPFMDGDVFPNTLEYWGPTGMVFFRNIQIRYAVLQGENELFVALERPGASADQGTFSDRTELDSVKGRFPYPDLSAHFKKSGKWGHVQLAGMLRSMHWTDIHTTGGYNISGKATGWGLHLSALLNIGAMDQLHASVIYGEGVQNYMNDAPVDVGVVDQPGNPNVPFTGKALPVTGIVAFYDHYWTKNLWTSFGWSGTHIDNTSDATPNTYKNGQYVIVNLVATPFRNAMAGIEFQWGKRDNFSDGFSSQATKLQASFKYNFSQVFYTHKK